MLELQGVTRNYGEHRAVDDLHLSIPSGQLFAFLGPNGAGKTTTIKMLTGLLRPSQGTIRVCGHDTAAASRAARKCIGYVPDQPYLYDKLTGREFLQFIGGMYGLSAETAERRLAEESNRFELSGFLDTLTESYSHGMKQRLVFAAALLHDPQVLILDEPMVGLDPRSARLVKNLLREQAALGTTVFMSTHSLEVAEEVSDRIGILNRGRLLFLGPWAELREKSLRPGASLEEVFLELTAPAPNTTEAAPR